MVVRALGGRSGRCARVAGCLPNLKPFEDGVAVLRRDDEVSGYLVTSVGTFRFLARPRTRQPWVWFEVVWVDGHNVRSRTTGRGPRFSSWKRYVLPWVFGARTCRAPVSSISGMCGAQSRERRMPTATPAARTPTTPRPPIA